MKSRITKIFHFTLLILAVLAFSVFSPSLSANQFYAEIEVDVTDAGFVTIDGTTNHPDLLVIDTQNYTSKTQDKWVLNITKNDVFSDFFFKVLLPPGSSIFQINTTGTMWIEEESNRLTIKGFGQNESFLLTVHYQITRSSATADSQMLSYYINIVFILIILVLIVLIFFSYYKSSNRKQLVGIQHDDMMKGLTERQRKIMKLLLEHDGPLTQTAIEKELHIPKAAVSRNIHSLERKGLLEIEKAGMSHFIHVKKP